MSTSKQPMPIPSFNPTLVLTAQHNFLQEICFSSWLSASLQNASSFQQCSLFPASLSLPCHGDIYLLSFHEGLSDLDRKEQHAQVPSTVAMIYFGLSSRSYYSQLHLSGFVDTLSCQGMLILTMSKSSIVFHMKFSKT